ncbi:hypothetical protein ID866_10273 [Astraeus odoratus]|nr:hypothetical protein ID866_10273 [Astraeus odoratus]
MSFDSTAQLADFVRVVLPYLDPDDWSKELHELTPRAEQQLFILYAMLLIGYHSDPSVEGLSRDLCFKFGFVASRGLEGEKVLPCLYQTLISKYSFKEFWTAFQSNTLIALMDANGLKEERKRIQYLDAFLEMKPGDWCPSVWHLRLFMHTADVDPPRHITIDYRFFNCNTVEEKFALEDVYEGLLNSPEVDPMELHAACIKGKLHDFACWYRPNLEQRFEWLMKNTYSLSMEN